MSDYQLVLLPQVDDDLEIAEDWYEEQKPGLGREFLLNVREAIDRLLKNPLAYRVVYTRRQVRCAYTRKFPYRIIFRVVDDTVVVYTIIHGKRHERKWKGRFSPLEG